MRAVRTKAAQAEGGLHADNGQMSSLAKSEGKTKPKHTVKARAKTKTKLIDGQKETGA